MDRLITKKMRDSFNGVIESGKFGTGKYKFKPLIFLYSIETEKQRILTLRRVVK